MNLTRSFLCDLSHLRNLASLLSERRHRDAVEQVYWFPVSVILQYPYEILCNEDGDHLWAYNRRTRKVYSCEEYLIPNTRARARRRDLFAPHIPHLQSDYEGMTRLRLLLMCWRQIPGHHCSPPRDDRHDERFWWHSIVRLPDGRPYVRPRPGDRNYYDARNEEWVTRSQNGARVSYDRNGKRVLHDDDDHDYHEPRDTIAAEARREADDEIYRNWLDADDDDGDSHYYCY